MVHNTVRMTGVNGIGEPLVRRAGGGKASIFDKTQPAHSPTEKLISLYGLSRLFLQVVQQLGMNFIWYTPRNVWGRSDVHCL